MLVFIWIYFQSVFADARVQLEPLSSSEISSLVQRLIEPPEEHSHKAKADIETVLQVQQNRTSEQCLEAKKQAKLSIESFYEGQTGINISPLLFQDLLDWVRPVIGRAKDRYGRPRPYVIDPRVVPCLPKEESASYPSGHSILAGLVGNVLAELYPAHKALFYSKVHEISKNRIIAGLHYPSDTVAGEEFGKRIFMALKQNRNYSAWIQQYAKP
jgi:acid phosphatase (class A)